MLCSLATDVSGSARAAEGDPCLVARSQGVERQGQGCDAARLLDLRRAGRAAGGDGAVRPLGPGRPAAAPGQRRHLQRARARRRRSTSPARKRADAVSGVDPGPRDGAQPDGAELQRRARLRPDRLPQDRARAAQARRLSRGVARRAARGGVRRQRRREGGACTVVAARKRTPPAVGALPPRRRSPTSRSRNDGKPMPPSKTTRARRRGQAFARPSGKRHA